MNLRQHQLPPARAATPGVDHVAENTRQQRGFKSSQLRGHWIRLQKAVTAWANRKDELRTHEAKMFEEAKRELDVVEAKLEAMRQEDEAEAEATAPEEE